VSGIKIGQNGFLTAWKGGISTALYTGSGSTYVQGKQSPGTINWPM